MTEILNIIKQRVLIMKGTQRIELIETNDAIYIGETNKNGKRNGFGTLYSNDGTIHLGLWCDGFASGHGICKHKNGNEYTGKWINNIFHGRNNEIYYSNGDKYRGNVVKGIIIGKGEMKYNNGDIYKGEWKNGVWEGMGEIKYKNNEKYKGLFKNGLYEDEGIFTWGNGNTYAGQWKNGEVSGYGTVINKTSSYMTYYSGNWNNPNEWNKHNLIIDNE